MFSITDIFLIATFGVIIVFYEMLSHGVLTMEMIQSIFSGNVNIYIIIAIAIIFFRKYLMRSGDNNLERTVLTLSNELQRMRTEAEWRNDAISHALPEIITSCIYTYLRQTASYFFLAGSNRFSSTSHVSMGQYSEYTDEYETYWVEFTALFNNRRKREARSPTQLYNILSIEIGLSASTLASFYRHQKSPRRTSMDKIIEWVEKEGNKKSVSFSDSSSSNNSSSSGSIRGSIGGGNIAK